MSSPPPPPIMMSAADYTVVAAFFVVMIGIGYFFAGRMHNAKDFFGGGQAVPWWLSSISYWMVSFSAFAFVAHSSLAYRFGFLPITIWCIGSLAAVAAAHLVAARWRRVATTSPMEFIERRYGRTMRQGLSWIGVILMLLDDATKILAAGYMISATAGVPISTSVLLCGSVILIYTFLGGLWAAVVNDCVQFVIMLTAVIVLIPLTLQRVGGWESFIEKLPAGSLSPVAGKYTWLYLTLLGIIQFLAYCTRWSLVQRFYSVPTDKDARKVCYLAATLNLAFAPALLFPAIAARIFLPGIENPDQIYGLICSQLLPVGMLGMLVAGILSSTMSTLSGDYNATAAVLTTDIYRRLIVPSGSDQGYLLAGRLFTALVGLVAMGLALSMAALGNRLTLFDLMVLIFSIFLPAMALPVIAGLTNRHVSNAGAIIGAISGVAISGTTAFWDPFLPARPLDRLAHMCGWGAFSDQISAENMLMLTSLTTVILGMLVGTLLYPGRPEYKAEVIRFLDGISDREPSRIRIAASDKQGFSPAPVVGVAIVLLGAVLALVGGAAAPLSSGSWSIGAGMTMCLLGSVMVFVPRWLGRSINGVAKNIKDKVT